MAKELDEAEIQAGKSVAGAGGGALYVVFLVLVGFLRALHALYRLLVPKKTPEFEPLDGDLWQNVTSNQFCRPSRVLRIGNRQQLVEAILDARRSRRRARAIGAGHSFSDAAVADDILLSLRGMNRVLELEAELLGDAAPKHALLRVESGISIRELNQALKARGLALVNMGAYDAQTISGAISTGTHGSGETLGALADVVRSVDFVDENGRVLRIEPAQGITDPVRYREQHAQGPSLVQDDELFYSVVVAMGCLGVVYSYVLEVRPRYYLHETRELVSWDELKPRLLTGDFAPRTGPFKGVQARHFEFLVSPYPLRDGQPPQCLATYRMEVEEQGKTSKARTRNPLLVILTSNRAFDDIVALALSTFPSLTPYLLARSLDSLVDEEFVAESFEVLNLGDANFIPAYSSELAFSAERGDTAPEYVRALEDLLLFARQQAVLGRWHTAPISVRFVKASPHHLAMSYGRPSAIFEIPMLARVPSGWDLLRYYERVFFERYRARPHWGQANFIIGPDRLAQMYPRLDAFVASYRRLCPQGTFDNSFSERLGLRTLAGPVGGRAMKEEPELGVASVKGVLRLLLDTLRWVVHDRVALIIGSTFVLIMLWGTHGNVDLLRVIDGWTGPGGDPTTRAHFIDGLPWDQEWIAFAIGVLLLVVVPCLMIRFVFHEKISDYGLGLPRPGTWSFTVTSTLLLAVIATVAAFVASKDAGMQATYPFFRKFSGLSAFLLYEAGYFFFFLVIEFIFRGYLLFGLYRAQDSVTGQAALGEPGPLVFGRYAILISMLSYTAWHLGKPLPEQYGTLLWGLVTGAMVLRSGTIWHVVLVHFGMNVGIDYLIWIQAAAPHPV